MEFLRLTSLYLLSFVLLLHGLHAADPLYHMCSSRKNYTANSPFSKNLNKMLTSLPTKVSLIGFGLSSVGKRPDQANGLSLCRGDVPSSDCKKCLVGAISDLRDLCPYKEDAVIWFDNCLLRYSNVDFFGEVDTINRFYMLNTQSVNDPAAFNKKTKELLHHLSHEAYLSPLMYASGDVEIGEHEKLYGLAQCTRDLSGGDCKKCLESAISDLPSCCYGKKGGRVVGGSCNIRYEIYPFLNA
ncbi:cysteine-rich repeat secretory protein 38-like [Magnolia sinica]|uniref:cysteine-rich repeat secretory protein 38-like n=1 Tax=Magnolia sinica TaxID=86752 RepID=UPI0026598A24|nr:cysteine-rich repeat secretory protein 38-like [Magnolia sinica]